MGVAAGAGTRHAHTGGAGAAGTTGSAPSAAAAPISDSELVSKYSTKQELGPSKSALDEEDPAPAAGGGTAGSRGPRTGAAGTAAASGTAPTGIGRGQSSDREPLPTSKNAGQPASAVLCCAALCCPCCPCAELGLLGCMLATCTLLCGQRLMCICGRPGAKGQHA